MNGDYTLQQPLAATPAPRKWNARLFLALALTSVAGVFYMNSQQAPALQQTAVKADVSLLGDAQLVQKFHSFKAQFNKSYANEEEEAMRMAIFKRNLDFIRQQNEMGHTYTLGVNQFADMTNDEFRGFVVAGYNRDAKHNSLRAGKMYGDWAHEDTDLLEVDHDELPAEKDWRQEGCVSKVESQGMCGSCWAWSAAGAIEGAFCVNKIREGVDKTVSPQQMVDCAEKANGCRGGLMTIAYDYLAEDSEVVSGKHGVCSSEEYAYTENDYTGCKDRTLCKEPLGQVTGYKTVPAFNGRALKAAVALRGPIAVAIRADEPAFQFYTKGVFTAPCGTELNHAVLLTGYGVDETGQEFWAIKNSWGEKTWGDNGYIYLGRGEDFGPKGQCGVHMDPNYPLVAAML
eukprot:GDKI01014574.1.p1 GENE.GDKI01014574.1~~GDKI01014574.1.p1  ORF type:complete len:411 (-),score=162.51 GDKI01014574.1:838-2040(-)